MFTCEDEKADLEIIKQDREHVPIGSLSLPPAFVYPVLLVPMFIVV